MKFNITSLWVARLPVKIGTAPLGLKSTGQS